VGKKLESLSIKNPLFCTTASLIFFDSKIKKAQRKVTPGIGNLLYLYTNKTLLNNPKLILHQKVATS
jgi:hypothetical protein